MDCMERIKRTILCLLAVAALAGVLAADVNVTGKWTGTFSLIHDDSETKDSTAVLNLKQTGAEITGTLGPNDDEQYPIQKGKIEGGKITLEAEHGGHSIKFNLVCSADHITGDANISGDNGEAAKAKIDVKREK